MAFGLFQAIRFLDDGPVDGAAPARVTPGAQELPRVLLSLITVIVTARLLGTAIQWVGQPRVIGEVVAGIVLGPSFLGRLSPAVTEFLLPESSMPTLEMFAQLGVVLYMFLVGLELNSDQLRTHAGSTVAISHASILAPFLLGTLLAAGVYRAYAPPGVTFTSFSLFVGVAMSITAFPVLARILTDLGIERTSLGAVALNCAAVDDVTAWCLLAFVVGVTQSNLLGAIMTLVLATVYISLMIGLVRPGLTRWLRVATGTPLSNESVAWILVGVLTSSLITEAIGIHAIFGAFLLGAIIPHESDIARSFRHKWEDVVSTMLIPTFFAFTGARTDLGILSGPFDWIICGVFIAVATAGKFGGTVVAARIMGLDWNAAASLGILMNTRGLMELIVLNVGLDLGVISPALFTMMVLMALATTVATSPILRRLVHLERST
ncbi:MAG: cation:proton antiporter [Planctomycetes bacterium]|nr:cation:proton antiporter [Planctomycetota bacterium]